MDKLHILRQLVGPMHHHTRNKTPFISFLEGRLCSGTRKKLLQLSNVHGLFINNHFVHKSSIVTCCSKHGHRSNTISSCFNWHI